MNILGLYGGLHLGEHDASAAIICDGQVVAVCEEERFLRVKSPLAVLPIESVKHCLKEAGLKMNDIDFVAHPGAIFLHLPPRISTYLEHYFGYAPPIRLIDHQLAHLASSFYCSGFDQSMCISYDGYGENISAALATADENGIKVLERRHSSNSLGLFYSCITSYLGFLVGIDEYKVMGLAPYGKEGIDLSPFLHVTDDGYESDTSYFAQPLNQQTEYEPFYGQKLVDLLGPHRQPGEPLTDRHRDVAFAAQKVLEDCVISLVKHLHKQTGMNRLCLAGGVALNSVANMRIKDLPFIKDLFVQPAASDRGLSLGCALQCAFEEGEPVGSSLKHAYFGPTYTEERMKKDLDIAGVSYQAVADPAKEAATLLTQGKIVAWFQGRSEFGPRALGHRSILADPRLPDIKEQVNARVKFREAFRPFAPAVLEEMAPDIYEMDGPSPFMTVTVRVREPWVSRLPGVTHVDGTARVQTLNALHNDVFYELVAHFHELTGVPVVLNTSFNIKGQPIVESPADALSTFFGSGIDVLFIGPFRINK
jgi:carbamoyltransferase